MRVQILVKMTQILLLLSLVNCLSVFGYKIIWDNDVEVDLNDIDEEFLTSGDPRMPNLFIYPGTKWCGTGNVAANDSDLGSEIETDKCCRTHDMCPDIIEGHQTKYGLENPSFYTRLNCNCDNTFYKCLKSADTRSSKQVGHIYFTGLGTQCYREEYPISGCNKYTSFPRRKCVDYSFNTSQPKKYQWFDLPNF